MKFQVVFSLRNKITDERQEHSTVVESIHWWMALIQAKRDMEWAHRCARVKTVIEVIGVYVQPQ